MAERRGGFRSDPQASATVPAIETALRRKNASFLRGVSIPSNGLYTNIYGEAGPWRYVGTSGNPSFQSSWINYGGSWSQAAFFKDALGIVHIRGLVKFGVIGTTVFTLPAGYRPKKGLILMAATWPDVFARIDIYADGTLVTKTGDNTWVSINVSFPAEQ